MSERTSPVVFNGDSDARVIELDDGRRIEAERGKKVDVPASIAAGLVEQDGWDRYQAPKRAKRAKANPAAAQTAPAATAAGKENTDQGGGESAPASE